MRRPERLGRIRTLYLSVPAEVAADRGAVWAEALRLEREMRGRAGALPDPRPSSVLVGGDAPELLGRPLCERVRRVLPEASFQTAEWTVEVGPGGVGHSALAAWKAGGVTRVCIRANPEAGPAGWDGQRLAILRKAKRVGFRVLAADVLVGNAGTTASMRSSVAWIDRLADAGVDHVSVYEHPDDAPAEAHARTRGEEGAAALWLDALRRLKARGFIADDLLNHGREGSTSRYARALRSRHPLLGLGPGAQSFRNPCRRWNVSEWWSYLEHVDSGSDPIESRECLDHGEVRLERVWLRLQSTRGLRLPSGIPELGRRLRQWTAEGWVERDERRVTLTPEGWLRLDGIALEVAGILSSTGR